MSLLTGLISYWKFNENSVDSHGSNHGTDTDISYVPAKNGNGALFNGISSKSVLTTPIVIPPFAEFTISFWIYGINTGHGLGGILSPIVGTNGILHFYSDSYCSIGMAGGSYTLFNPIPVNQWSHIVLTGDSTGVVKMYCNTVLSPNIGKNDTVGYIFENFGYTGQYNAYLDTKIDEFGYWDRLLNDSEISNLYNNGSGLTYPFASGNKSNFLQFFK